MKITSPAKTLSRETLLPMLAAHVLVHGLGGASLRPLAKAAGTSDRMLIYHVGNKEALLTAALDLLAHEQSEADIVESAFLDDLGGID